MAKRYARINFVNNVTTLGPTNLNKMDKGIDDLDNAVEEIESEISSINTSLTQLNNNLGDQYYKGSYVGIVTFGANAIDGRYRSTLIYIPRCNAFKVTITAVIAQGVKIIELSKVSIDFQNKVGFCIACTDSTVVGQSVDIEFTLSQPTT